MFGRDKLGDIAKASGYYFTVPNGIYKALSGKKIRPGAKLILIYMLHHKETFHPTQKRISEDLEIKQPHVHEHLKKLVEVGVIKIFYESHRKVTQYTLNLDTSAYTNDTFLDTPEYIEDTPGYTKDTPGYTKDTPGYTKDTPGYTNNKKHKTSLQDEPKEEQQNSDDAKNFGSSPSEENGSSKIFRPPYETYSPSIVERAAAIKIPKTEEKPFTLEDMEAMIAQQEENGRKREERLKAKEEKRQV